MDGWPDRWSKVGGIEAWREETKVMVGARVWPLKTQNQLRQEDTAGEMCQHYHDKDQTQTHIYLDT